MANWARPLALALGTSVALTAVTLVAVAATQGDGFRVTRSRVMPVPAEAVRRELGDVTAVDAWSAPNRPEGPPVTTFSSQRTGVGAWVEHRAGGALTRMTIASLTDEGARYDLETSGALGSGRSRLDVVLRDSGSSTSVDAVFSSSFTFVTRLLWPVVHKGLTASANEHLDRCLNALERRARTPAAAPPAGP
ncbi:MAG: SRPBCC family protein [Myxococcaceae bacterium]|nr:SRPBCC family protein [Myxococcaceae bacterium]MCA3016507.1 SRPBCC family protein [Myxococcaceae bacterium]